MNEIFERIDIWALHDPARIALQGAMETVSYGELGAAIAEKEMLLRNVAVRALGIDLSNGPEWVLWDLAALKSGVICVPLPPFFTVEQVDHVIRSAGIDHIISENGLWPTGMKAVPLPEGTAKITFTSGTTGAPKGVCLSATALERVANSLSQVLGPDYAGTHLSVMPLAILLENIAGVYTSLMAGATVSIPGAASIGMDNPFQPDFIKLAMEIAWDEITSIILVPELLRGLMQEAHYSKGLFSSLRFVAVGGSRVSLALIQGARALGLPVYEGYGLSECASVVSLNTPHEDHPGSVGRLLPHVKATIIDDEIVIHDPGYLGYLGGGSVPPASFSTGDIGSIDEDGALHIDGRKKNIIITAYGRNIAPEWLESLLLAQPEVMQAVVYGDDFPAPGALIVPSAPGLDMDAVVARINRALPAYAQLGSCYTVPPFTMRDGTLTGTGRPRREAVLSHYQSLIAKEESHDILRQAG